MAENKPSEDEEEVKKKSKLPLIIGLVLMLAGGGGGFFAVQSGLLFGSDGGHDTAADDAHADEHALPALSFVAVDPLIINLGNRSKNDYLRFRAQLEVSDGFEEEVTLLLPRVVDVLNGYLRAVEIHDLEDPNALIRLRAQMLRRIQTVTGKGRVRDLLIMEFVLN